MINWSAEKSNLEKFIFEDKKSYEEIGRYYGCSGNNVRKQAKKLGLELPQRRKINQSEHFNKGSHLVEFPKCLNCGKELGRSGAKFCNNKCQNDYYYKEWVKSWKEGNESGLSGEYGISNYLKRYIFEKYDCKCAKCGWAEVNPYTGKVPLEIDHIDGDYTNNSEENLILLCPNHHALTSTYKGANVGHGRKNRSKYYKKE